MTTGSPGESRGGGTIGKGDNVLPRPILRCFDHMATGHHARHWLDGGTITQHRYSAVGVGTSALGGMSWPGAAEDGGERYICCIPITYRTSYLDTGPVPRPPNRSK